MLVLGIAVAVALLLPLFTGGSYTRLVMTDWRWSALLFGGLGLQLALELLPIPESRWDDLGFGLLVLSYVLIIAFCARNALLRGMTIVLIGVACNTIAIVVNNGMPVEVPPDLQDESWVEPTIKHHPQSDDDQLMFLADIIVLREPLGAAISFGDLIIAVGLCDVTYHASRKRKSRESIAVRASSERATIDLNPLPEPVAATTATNGSTPSTESTESTAQPAARLFSSTARSSALSTRSS
jgi:hypothetical protein